MLSKCEYSCDISAYNNKKLFQNKDTFSSKNDLFRIINMFCYDMLWIWPSLCNKSLRYHVSICNAQYTIKLFHFRADIRMNIYSAYGMNGLPWELVVSDLCKNKMPKIDDPRWLFTHDAPRRKRTQFGLRYVILNIFVLARLHRKSEVNWNALRFFLRDSFSWVEPELWRTPCPLLHGDITLC